jgi:aromatic ring-opening dioxygenase catalytic subunit (LigB family)
MQTSPLSTQRANQEHKHRMSNSQYTIDNWCERRGNHQTGEWHRTYVRSVHDPWINTDALIVLTPHYVLRHTAAIECEAK